MDHGIIHSYNSQFKAPCGALAIIVQNVLWEIYYSKCIICIHMQQVRLDVRLYMDLKLCTCHVLSLSLVHALLWFPLLIFHYSNPDFNQLPVDDNI